MKQIATTVPVMLLQFSAYTCIAFHCTCTVSAIHSPSFSFLYYVNGWHKWTAFYISAWNNGKDGGNRTFQAEPANLDLHEDVPARLPQSVTPFCVCQGWGFKFVSTCANNCWLRLGRLKQIAATVPADLGCWQHLQARFGKSISNHTCTVAGIHDTLPYL